MSQPGQIPANRMPHRTPAQLLTLARRGLIDAAATRPASIRYSTAHLAALRAAAAVLAARATADPHTPRSRASSVWDLLARVTPDLTTWAGYWSAAAPIRAAAEAGLPRAVTAADADAHLHAARQFVTVVEAYLGHTPPAGDAGD